MCSFLITNCVIANLLYVNYFLKLRGPDYTNEFFYHGFNFIHNLLQITGETTPQPFVDTTNDIICLYNGEIYNYQDFGNYNSDGQCLLDVYKKYGKNFVKYLDGEFAIVIFDFKQNIIVISTDIFSTKPLWYATQEGQIAISSYESPLQRLGFSQRNKVPANTTHILNLSNFLIYETHSVYDFDLNQHKDNYDDWNVAFDRAIKKRAYNMKYPIFLCLSSGYDSGCIAASLNKQNIPYTTYTIMATENQSIVEQRMKINGVKNTVLEYTSEEFDNKRKLLKDKCEEFTYKKIHNDTTKMKMTDDPAATGLSYICEVAKGQGIKIFLSGQGGDEIYSDYGYAGKKIFDHSGFGGAYPQNLKDVFPIKPKSDANNIPKWYSFYEGTMVSYLAKEEQVSGAWGIEGRYPFLDKMVVQEFLWLKPELKNSIYKAPLYNYLKSCNYPFENGVKIGFAASQNLKSTQKESSRPEPIITISKNKIIQEIGYCHILDIGEFTDYSDSEHNHKKSTLKVYENNKELPMPHILHADIRSLGAGRYSHWKNKLYFSALDNSNPKTNNNIYKIKLCNK